MPRPGAAATKTAGRRSTCRLADSSDAEQNAGSPQGVGGSSGQAPALANIGLVVVGKAPEPGHVKTRLCPPLTPPAAAALYGAFLADTLALAHRFAARRAPGSAVYLVHPPGAADGLGQVVPAGTRLLAQSGSNLGDALAGAFDQVLAQGHAAAIIVGSDLPHMPLDSLASAAAALRWHDLALGPAEDGGYYLIAARRRYQPLFDGVAWSTGSVLQQTLQRAAASGLSAGLLSPCWDVDTGPDLRRLVEYLTGVGTVVAPRTRAVLASLTTEGLLPRQWTMRAILGSGR